MHLRLPDLLFAVISNEAFEISFEITTEQVEITGNDDLFDLVVPGDGEYGMNLVLHADVVALQLRRHRHLTSST
jgi:hypothetical protein